MASYTPELTYQYFDQLIETKTPIVPMLSYVRVKKNGVILEELNIIYYNHKKQALSKIYNNDFATFMFDNLMSLERGMSSKVLAGIVRPSKPDVIEQWRGDTIEKFSHESFSLYRGLLSIIGKNDGLPLVISQHTGVVGDIIPGIKQILTGKNPTKVHKIIKNFETLQNRIANIVGSNPCETATFSAQESEVQLKHEFQDLNDKQIARLKKLKNL